MSKRRLHVAAAGTPTRAPTPALQRIGFLIDAAMSGVPKMVAGQTKESVLPGLKIRFVRTPEQDVLCPPACMVFARDLEHVWGILPTESNGQGFQAEAPGGYHERAAELRALAGI